MADSAEAAAVPGNLKGLVLSVLLIAFCWIVSSFFKDKVIARKVLHIGVSNWFFIYFHCFTSWYFPVAGLGAAALLNLFLELKSSSGLSCRRSYGTVIYPLMVIACIIASELGFGSKICVGCALLGMGYGDGFAAVAGLKLGKRKMPFSSKTVVGSLTVFILVSAVELILTDCSVFTAGLIGLTASICECYCPGFVDNIAVPAVIYIMTALLV